MKHHKQRKIVGLPLDLNELLELLHRHGYLPDELHAGDVRVVDVRADRPTGDCITVYVEGDSLPERFRYRGHFHSAALDLKAPAQSPA